jgi:hypothetical protein
MRILRNMTFNETEITTSINIQSLSEKATTLTTSTEITEIIEKIPDINDADIADANDANTTFENIENASFESNTIEPAPVRRSTRHKKATFKTVRVNAVIINAVEVAEAPTTPTDEKESEKEDYLPKAIIAKTIIANENKPTYEEAMANSKKSQ